MTRELIANVTCVAIDGRGLLIEGPPGSGKSSLALALIDRGARLVGDDGIEIENAGGIAVAHPPPNIASLLEIRGVGIVTLPAVSAPLCLVLDLGETAERLPVPGSATRAGLELPRLPFAFDHLAAIRAEWALREHGLAHPDGLIALFNASAG